MKNKIENVVIVAGGLNTRMEDLSVFPKVLFPMPNCSSILTYDTMSFKDKKVYLVINEKYYDMVASYVERNNLKLDAIIKTTNTDGSANTLKEISDKLPEKDTLLVWSDLIIEHFEMLESLLESTEKDHVILTQSGLYRFKTYLSGDKVCIKSIASPKPHDIFVICGDVPGIYFYKKKPEFEKISRDSHNYDYLEFIIDNYAYDIELCPVGSKLIEFRDKQKFKEYYTKGSCDSEITRFFNSIEINKDKKTLTKTCKNPEYTHLMENEHKWYKKVKEVGFTGVPEVYSFATTLTSDDKKEVQMSMEYLDGYVTASEFAKTHSQEEIKAMVEKIVSKADELHRATIPVEFLDVQEDYEEEFVDKVLRRCDSIKGMLVKYDRDELERLLTKAFNILYHDKCKVGVMPNTTYSLIHGDLNGSNVMYNETTGDVKFIDPRGYFGKTKLFGPEEYDFAKILYFLSGYDIFNKSRVVYNDWKFDWECVLDVQFTPDKLMQWNLHIIVGIIWIALAQYIAQDIMKANLAYEHGMDLLREALEDKDN